MFKKLHTKMIFTFTILILVSLSTLSFINYSQVSKQVNTEVRSNASEQATELKNLIDLYLNQYSLSIHQFSHSQSVLKFVEAGTLEDRQLAWSELTNDFANFLELNPKIQIIYIGDPKKNMDTVPHVDLTNYDPTSRPWYIEASHSPGEVIWTEPYIDEITKEYVITAAKAIQNSSNKVMGVIGIDISLDELEALVTNVQVSHNGYPFLFDQSGRALVHPTMRGEDLSDLSFVNEMYQSSLNGIIDYNFEEVNRVLIYDSLDTTGWKVGTVYIDKHLKETANGLRNTNVLVSIIIIIIAIVITYGISINISRPISNLTKEIHKIANGDLTISFTSKSKDEVGQLTESLSKMVSNLKQLIEAVGGSAKTIGFSSENLSAIAEETTASNEEVARAVTEIANGTTEVASTCEDTNKRTSELSNLIEDVTTQIINIKQLSNQSENENHKGMQQVEALRSSTKESTKVIDSVQTVIHSLSTKINDIEKIMHAISTISDQTNLLALNASIEAARAGEHGKGFAVVANEVRKLADESNKATEEVRQTLSIIQNEAKHAVNEMSATQLISSMQNQSVESTEKTFSAISDVTFKMIASMETLTNQINKVNSYKEEVVGSIQDISGMVEEFAAASEEVSASASEQIVAIQTVADQAQQLRESSEELELLIQKFKLS
ncbi:MAG: methyl-accepting chemotaxis protein [Anaerobacillus sp.]|uniref:methyl-accepting chemotaxis protein n=1 Tax=Anaerobacillus sp. TaxID=1872506 RepID=UPI00391A10DA